MSSERLMTAKIFSDITGFFIYDVDDNLIAKKLYPKNANEIAQKIHNLTLYNNSDELQELFNEIEIEKIITNSNDVLHFGRSVGKKCELNLESEVYTQFKDNLTGILIEDNYISNIREYIELVREVGIILSKKKVAHSSQRVDKMVVHAILSMDDIDKTANLFVSRIREWYGTHFPEILKIIENHVTLCKIITEIGSRSDFTVEKLHKFGFSSQKSAEIAGKAKSSMGADYSFEDLLPLRQFASRNLDLYEERERLETWIERELMRVAPNLQAVAGSAISARLIALAGGLREMAMLPASTVQLLGAEKALFRSLKSGAKPPKHGIIYQIPELHSCPWWQRGNIARAIAGRLTIAARVDAFQGEFVGDQLRKDLERKIEEIKKKYENPPEGKKEPIKYDFKPSGDRRPRSGYSKPRSGHDKGKPRYGKGKPKYTKGKPRYNKKRTEPPKSKQRSD